MIKQYIWTDSFGIEYRVFATSRIEAKFKLEQLYKKEDVETIFKNNKSVLEVVPDIIVCTAPQFLKTYTVSVKTY